MRRVVLDTHSNLFACQSKNCLLQALPSRSPYHKIWTEVLAGRIMRETITITPPHTSS
ncbi:MAG: hypothetical protein IJJ56_12830 [Prevotella sp.]|nr:hypothetical protein [Prevotella sp.]